MGLDNTSLLVVMPNARLTLVSPSVLSPRVGRKSPSSKMGMKEEKCLLASTVREFLSLRRRVATFSLDLRTLDAAKM